MTILQFKFKPKEPEPEKCFVCRNCQSHEFHLWCEGHITCAWCFVELANIKVTELPGPFVEGT